MSGVWRPTYRHVFAVLAAVVSVYFGLRTSQAVLENQGLARQLAQQRSLVRTAEQQNSDLRAAIAYAQTPAYVEGVARQQLGLMKPGDHVVYIRVDAGATTAAATAPSPTPAKATSLTRPGTSAPLPIWRRWLRLLTDPVPAAAP